MDTVQTGGSRPYDVHIGNGLLDLTGNLLRDVCTPGKIVIVTDDHVAPLYACRVQASLEAAGLKSVLFTIPAGEASKSLTVLSEVLNFLAQQETTREDCLIALGGGVVGDLTGFAAACYLRGIDYVQIPTSLLAMVDSSVGGKTAVDLPAGKNLCGAFWQPRLVLCDCDTLDTLPSEYLTDGMGEVIKYAVLQHGNLSDITMPLDRQAVIRRCVEVKKEFVETDERDNSQRRLLNLGHTVGHAAEQCSSYALSHGRAVSVGLAAVTRAAAKSGLCPAEDAALIVNTLERNHLPTHTDFSADELFSVMLQDKKRNEEGIDWIVPFGIGNCRRVRLSLTDSRHFLEAGL